MSHVSFRKRVEISIILKRQIHLIFQEDPEKTMAGSKKAVRSALRDEKRKRLADDKDVIVDESAADVEEDEEEGLLLVFSSFCFLPRQL